jgi:UDP-glucose 4-epimerase
LDLEASSAAHMPTTLVTGGAGYIGSHMTYALLDRGEDVVVLDNLTTGIRGLVGERAKFVEGNADDQTLVARILREHPIDAVIHFAGSIVVPESVEQPLKYYANNTVATRALLEACIDAGVRNFIFSSTAAVFSDSAIQPLSEDSAKAPISPYARSKLMSEWMLQDASRAHDFRHIVLRYFNVAGADPKGRTGQSGLNATHLIKRAARVALGRLPRLDIFGTDYPTPDGTGVRDYIHVADLIEAHLLALDALRQGHGTDDFNCGYGHGLSVREIVQAVERVTGARLAVREAPRRPGDPPMLVADPRKLKESLKWTPRHDNVEEIVRSALAWERHLNA